MKLFRWKNMFWSFSLILVMWGTYELQKSQKLKFEINVMFVKYPINHFSKIYYFATCMMDLIVLTDYRF